MNLIDFLGIKTESCTSEQATLTLQVTDQLKQPFGLVHGGINAVLAETAASLAANEWLKKNQPGYLATGANISTEHLRPVTTGTLTAKATALKTGHRLQVWQVKIFNQEKLTSFSTVNIVNIKRQ